LKEVVLSLTKAKKGLICFLVLLVSLVFYLTFEFYPRSSAINKINVTLARYIDYSSTLQWDKARELLTGEALAQTIRNQGIAVEEENIMGVKYNTTLTNDNLATVEADIEKADDRQVYTFHLVKMADNWLIYKVGYKDFTRPVIDKNEGNSKAAEVLSEYLSLNAKQRTDEAQKYLAGNLLRATLTNRPLPQSQPVKELNEKMLSITPIGATKELATYQAVLEASVGTTIITTTLLVDLVEVNGSWKIVNIDIVKVV